MLARDLRVKAERALATARELQDRDPDGSVNRSYSGVIAYRKIGTRRRVLFEHPMAYKKAEDAKRMEALNGLTRQAQVLGLGY